MHGFAVHILHGVLYRMLYIGDQAREYVRGEEELLSDTDC